MERRRFLFSLLGIAGLISFFIGRLLWIQVVDTHSYTEHKVDLLINSVAQRERGLVLDSGRGQFYDRSLQQLTGATLNSLVIFPLREEFAGTAQQHKELAHILNVSEVEWNRYRSHLSGPQLWTDANAERPIPLSRQQVKAIESLHLPGLRIMPYMLRYSDDYTARHVIGYIGENPQRVRELYGTKLDEGEYAITKQIGASGLEKTLDQFLQGAGKTSVSFFTDANKKPLAGLDVRVAAPTNPYYPLNVITTLDITIQQKIEALLDRNGLKQAAVVVLDASNADVIAMASRPQFDPYHVDPQNENWNNKAIQAVTPGSIFKTVVAAAALEEGVVEPEEKFMCSGELGKYGFSCWKKGGHGSITFGQAYAESCNITFAQVMERLSSDQLSAYAEKLGLLQRVGWSSESGDGNKFHQLDREQAGQLFSEATDQNDDGVRVQTSIGQRDVQVTPLQAANLIVTLLHNGEVKSPRIVKEIDYHNGLEMTSFSEHTLIPSAAGISGSTAKKLQQFMEEVVDTGTGTYLQKSAWKLAGKSGTAETKGQLENQWFIGYGPVESPRYAVSVMVQNVPANRRQISLHLFYEVMEIVEKSE